MRKRWVFVPRRIHSISSVLPARLQSDGEKHLSTDLVPVGFKMGTGSTHRPPSSSNMGMKHES